MNQKSKMLAGVAGATLVFCASAPASAQTATAVTSGPAPVAQPNDNQLEEIIVTAERHSVNLQRAALSVDVVSGSELEGTNVASYRDALTKTNNVVVQGTTNASQPTPVIAIRGLGTDGGSRTDSTAVYVDGIINNNANLQFYDLERVEVLSGPQATLYGGVATGGAVNVISSNPSFSGVSGDARIGYGNHDTLSYGGMINVPLSDKVAFRAAVNGQRRDNYWGDAGDGRSEVNGRVKLRIEPTDTLSIVLGGEIYHFGGNIGEALSFQDANGVMARPVPLRGAGHVNDYKAYANINWKFGFGNLTSITAYQASDTNIVYQGVPFAPINPVFTSGSSYVPKQDQLTQELRLSSNPGSPVTWVAGMYFQRIWTDKTNGSDSSGAIPLRNPAPVIFAQTIDVTQYHPFAQVTVPLSDSVRITGGISYDSYRLVYPQDQTFPAGPYPVSFTSHYDYDKTFHSVDGIARIEADLAPSNLVYASFSTGFRPGGPGGGKPAAFYGIERVRAYEIGSKNRFFQDRLQLNGALYYYDFPSLQNQTNTLDNNGIPQQGTVILPAKFFGAELLMNAKISRADTLSLKAGYEHGRYKRDITFSGNLPGPNPFTPGPLVTYVVPTDGARVTHTPDWNLSAEYSHRFDFSNGSNLFLKGGARYTSTQTVSFDVCAFSAPSCVVRSSIFTGPIYQSQYVQKGYTLFNAAVTFTSANDRFSLTAYARNIANKLYKTNTTFGLANPGDPATYGIQAAVKF